MRRRTRTQMKKEVLDVLDTMVVEAIVLAMDGDADLGDPIIDPIIDPIFDPIIDPITVAGLGEGLGEDTDADADIIKRDINSPGGQVVRFFLSPKSPEKM